MQLNQLATQFQGFSETSNKFINQNNLFLMLAAISVSFATTLWLPHVGEEGVYTISSIEMLFRENYMLPSLFGSTYSRPPLYNWLILLFTHLMGPENVLVAARLVTALSTLATAALLAWFVNRLFQNKNFAVLTAVVFLSGDVLFRRGWLAYSDPLFALFVFASMGFLWIAVENRQNRWLVLAGLSLSLGFLAKVHTIYIFYGCLGIVLLWRHPNRWFLFYPGSWLVHVLAIAFPMVWTTYLGEGRNGSLLTTFVHASFLFQMPSLLEYFIKTILGFPVEIILRMLPVSFVAIYAYYKLVKTKGQACWHPTFIMAFWVVLLNLLPYWVAPKAHPRYILPLYPFIAFMMTYLIWQLGGKSLQVALRLLLIGIAVKFLVALIWFPYDQSTLKGNALQVATDILRQTDGRPLYVRDSSSTGIRVAAEINRIQMQQAPLVYPPASLPLEGFVINQAYDIKDGQLIETYSLGTDKLYLQCKGSDCS